ncbi:MAG: hypothetical protein ACI4EU_04685 [Butyrivibrio sp.]
MEEKDLIPHYIAPEDGYIIPAKDEEVQAEGGENPMPDNNAPGETGNRKKTKKNILIIVAVAVVLVAAMLVILKNINDRYVRERKIVNLKKYIEIKFSGSDTYGSVKTSVSRDVFVSGVLEAMGASDDDEKAVEKAEDIYYSLCIETDSKENLSNGDKIKVDASWKQEAVDRAGITLAFTPYDVEVSGLQEIRIIDPFDYVIVTFSGFTDDMSANVENISDDYRLAGMSFYVETEEGYRYFCEGDRVYVCVSPYSAENIAEKYGIKLEPMSKSYIVKGECDKYITNIDYIYASLLEEAREEALYMIERDYPGEANAEYVGEYFVASEDGRISNYSNALYLIFKGQVTGGDGNVHELYIPVRFNSLVTTADGTQTIRERGEFLTVDYDLEYYGYTDEKEMFDDLIVVDRTGYMYQVRGDLQDFGQRVLLPSECADVVEELIGAGTFTKEGTTIMYADGIVYSRTGSWDINDFVSSENIGDDRSTSLLMSRISEALSLGENVTEYADVVYVDFWIGAFWFEYDPENGAYYLMYKFV